ncbi:Serum paraoxonase arylesterase [Apiospora arundinis]|uniref:Serum paraoxonase arylesterase n=1 Tax=Apiospora arundinis TaxID=335852 RepID=A0ABR2JGN0_9PEZI
MAGLKNVVLGILAIVLGNLYANNVHVVLYTGVRLFFGIGHTLEPLSAFPYKCRRIEDERLQACEDMWLSESTRQLFLACSESKGRQQWSPNGGQYNASGRSLNDHITVLNIDEPEPAGPGFVTRVLETPRYPGTHGDGRLHLVGMTGHDANQQIRLWLVNAKPSVDPATGRLLPDDRQAANQTVEVFTMSGAPGTVKLEHLQSFWDPLIRTPNRVAAVGDATNGFWVTNDLGHSESSWKRNLSPLLSQGSVIHCSHTNRDDHNCTAAIPTGLSWPNGLVHDSRAGLLYVPSSMLGIIDIYNATGGDGSSSSSLVPRKIDTVDVGYSIDNLMVDRDGDVWAAVFPVAKDIRAAFEDSDFGAKKGPSTAAMRIRKTKGAGDGDFDGYVVEKVLEDGFGDLLPVSTSVVHDAKTGRLFFSSVISPFIAVCDKI